jgi:hypothetical protein
MRVRLFLAPGVGYEIEMPSGWAVMVEEDPPRLRGILRGMVAHKEHISAMESGDADFGILPFEIPVGLTLEQAAEQQMLRHTQPGFPDEFPDTIDGRPALGFGWTNGAWFFATWFVALAPAVVVRIDYGGPPPNLREDRLEGDPRQDGVALLAGLRWLLGP